MSVGLACLLTHIFNFFFAESSRSMPWQAQFHHKYQHWPGWQRCMPQNGTFIEYWSYALLSVGLARLFLSLSKMWERGAHDQHSLTQLDLLLECLFTHGFKFRASYFEPSFLFNGCWSRAPLSHFQGDFAAILGHWTAISLKGPYQILFQVS